MFKLKNLLWFQIWQLFKMADIILQIMNNRNCAKGSRMANISTYGPHCILRYITNFYCRLK